MKNKLSNIGWNCKSSK